MRYEQELTLEFPYVRLQWLHQPETGIGIARILNEYNESVGIALGSTDQIDRIQVYTWKEWWAFRDGVKNDDFAGIGE